LSHYGRIVLLILFTIGCSSNNTTTVEENVLAQINDLSVSVVHFENAFKERYYRTGQVLTPSESTRKAILDSEFNTYVMAVYAKDVGLDETSEAIYQKSAIEKRVLTEEYLNQVILSDIEVTDSDLREYFIRFNSSLRASHIYARTKEEADAYYLRLQQGETFEELAKEAFENPYMSQNGGDIGRFTTDELDVAFENQAFSMNMGDISQPIQTAQGFSIIKLTDRVTVPLLTEYQFNQSRGRLESYVRKKKEEIAKRQHLETFNNEVNINQQISLDLFDLISGDIEGLLNKSPEFFSQLDLNTEILTYESFTFTTDNLQEEFLSSSVAMLNTIQDESSFRNFLVGVAYRAYMVEEVEKLGINDQPLVQESIEETYLHYLEELAMNSLASTISNTQAELYEIFESRMEEFYQPAEIRVQRLVVNGEDFANQIHEELLAGADFAAYVMEHTTVNEDLFTEGDLGFVPLDDFGYNIERISRLELGEISEPMLYTGDEFHIYKILDRKDARQLTFDEARDMVDSFLTRQKLQSKRAETISDVKLKHNAIVDLEKLNALTIKI
jgi:parvulin-like peptidyl-prolyl isomerase